MARKTKEIPITEQQKQELLIMSRSEKLEYRYVLRSKIILRSLECKTVKDIVYETKSSRRTVIKWRNRFRENGIDGLKDLPRPGKKPIYSPEKKVEVIEKACSKPEGGYTNWSQQRIADEVGMSRSHVNRILIETDLKPHKTEYWCGKSKDPEFKEKMTNIVGLYINPPENAIIICVDEKTQIQALDRTQPELPLRQGNPKR